MDLFDRATNPLQYDSSELDWKKEGDDQSPRQILYEDYFKRFFSVDGKSVLDIGSGTGTFFPFYKKQGALRIVGIEPAQRNFEISRTKYPDIEVFAGPFESYKSDDTFDVIISIMTLKHVASLHEFFTKVDHFLKKAGKFYVVVGDFNYFTTPRFDYQLEIQHLSDGEVAVGSKRPYGYMYDVIRPLQNYINAAKKTGLTLSKQVPVIPTDDFLKRAPKYESFRNTPILHLLIFEKNQLIDPARGNI